MSSQPAIRTVRERTTIRRAFDSSGTGTSRGSTDSVPSDNCRLVVGVTVLAVIAIAIAVAVGMNVDVVQNDAEQTSPDRGEASDGPLSSVTAGSAVGQNEDSPLELLGRAH